MTKLMLLGGISDNRFPEDLIRSFVEHAGGPDDARIFLVPAATEDVDRLVNKYENAFLEVGCRHLRSNTFRDRDEIDAPENLELLNWASAVFFTGGDQLRLLDVLRDSEFERRLHRRFHEGLHVGGSSAGAMALGNPVIIRGIPEDYMTSDSIRFESGLGLIPGIVVDTHLTERNRLGRLIHATAIYPGTLGLGLDENTGVLLDSDGFMSVHGPGTVTVLDGRDWNGFNHATSDSADERLSSSRLTVEKLVLNIYKSSSPDISLRMPVVSGSL